MYCSRLWRKKSNSSTHEHEVAALTTRPSGPFFRCAAEVIYQNQFYFILMIIKIASFLSNYDNDFLEMSNKVIKLILKN